ncbi:Anaerobic dehydrogenase typically selenocysteine-containing [Paramagnetospirillum magnetotacticum MS-1]|uniref:Anaerobic dehydrogenase typically selenocysteine-containing n=1 Tax=Paramagnetospirillum magnetotacticum MS-1 TaxID=272627 RepID=A0A0C2Z0A7_PARME|nr:molybdopterin-dependent oxidoreductase [Paramagnetospirillum magnetotacticum]KIM00341.1 Anaerobic dehydrogenase typically selenocysteine-containing [Paramagnetospirillum magnetotacticum MS-1]
MLDSVSGGKKTVPTYCYNCVAGPDLMCVTVEDGVATGVTPNHDGIGIHPADGRPCVKAYGLVQKTYNPNRILTPMKRTNPKKGRHEDPGFVAISWDEALDLVAEKLRGLREAGLLNEQGMPRLAATFGHGGTPANYMGTLPCLLAAWGPIDFSFGSGQGVKCVHSEHLYGEYWHRAFTVAADTPSANYIVSFGTNVEVSGGPCAVRRHADARIRGIKRVQVEPHLSPTGACSAEWVPIRPKTDPAFMFAMLNVMLHEAPRGKLDLAFLRDRTASPYLVGDDGWYLRDEATGKPLVWDTVSGTAVPHDHANAVPALEGDFTVPRSVAKLPDGETAIHQNAKARTAFQMLVEGMAAYTPEWAESVCDVPAATMRRVATEFLDNACVGQTVEVNGKTLPYRPVAVTLGKTVNNGWGAYECCWARTVLATLVGALEVPGGTLGTTVRLNRPYENRLKSVKPGEDGFMTAQMNSTRKGGWADKPKGRNAHTTLIPIVGDSSWAQALGPTHLAWMFLKDSPEGFEPPLPPDVWIAYRTNPAVSFWDTAQLSDNMAKMPFVMCFAYTMDETNHMADVLLPEATDLESTQLIRAGGSKFVEQHWAHQGFVLRQPAVAPQGEARDFTWITGELARRTGLLAEYNRAINKGFALVPLKGEGYDVTLPEDQVHDVDTIWDRVCRAATAGATKGEEVHGLDWMKEHGFFMQPFAREDWYLHPAMEEQKLRYELPYQERLMRVGEELRRRLHEAGIFWWDEQLEEYQGIPHWHDVPGRWVKAVERAGAHPDDFPFWGITTKTMPYTTGNNAGIPLMNEVAGNLRGHGSVIINASSAKRLGIKQGDWVEVSSVVGRTRGRAALVQGCRPDTVVIPGQFQHWKTPFAKDLNFPSLNTITQMSLELTDATGSGADLVRVAIAKVDGPLAGDAP